MKANHSAMVLLALCAVVIPSTAKRAASAYVPHGGHDGGEAGVGWFFFGAAGKSARVMKQVIDQKELSGMVTILARHGKVVDYRIYGQRTWGAARR